jgi:hypothetical protein
MVRRRFGGGSAVRATEMMDSGSAPVHRAYVRREPTPGRPPLVDDRNTPERGRPGVPKVA